jgi:FtsP/CotA-like multicopper oxidase with cupredoxin domain
MLVDRTFLRDNELANPFAHPDPGGPDLLPRAGDPPNDEVVGDHVLVNGAPAPHFDVADRRYRFRILNAANFQAYNLHLSNDADMVQVATESGLLPRPAPRKTILLGPGERAEVVVDFAGQRGKEIVLESVPRANRPAGATDAADQRVMQFRVTRSAGPDTSSVPAELRPAPEFDTAGATRRTWTLALENVPGSQPAWTINGQTFDHGRVDAQPRLGSVEVWQYTNTSSVTHYMHNHDVDFRLLQRDGQPPEPWEDGLKETFRVDPGETIQVAARFTDHTGTFVLHCHMLEHEDHGMMTQFEVVSGAQASVRAVAEFRDAGGHEAGASMCKLHRPGPA